MRVRTLLVGLAVAFAVSTAWAAQTGVRAIDITGLDLGEISSGYVETPTVITSPEELYDAIRDEEAATAINGQVDFTREIVLYFKWVGSGEDRLTATFARAGTGRRVEFLVTPGMTVDLFPHHHLFAIPNDANWSVEVTAIAER